MGTSSSSTTRSASTTRRRTHKSSHTRKNKLKPNDPLPPGTITKELSCASCRIRKTRCSGDRPACVQCTKAAVAKGFVAEHVRCVYSAASVFATRDDVAFEQQVGGRGARCIWDPSAVQRDVTPSPVVASASSALEEADATAAPTATEGDIVVDAPAEAARAEPPVAPLPSPKPEPQPLPTPASRPSSPVTAPLTNFTPDLPDFNSLFDGLTAVPTTSTLSPTALSFILPPPPSPLPLPPRAPSPSPSFPLHVSTRSPISSISLFNPCPSVLPPPPLPSTMTPLRSPSPLSPSTPEEPLPSTADVAFWEWGPLSLGEVDAWPGLSYVATQSGITH
ncbi:hypothetical protein JCM10908_005884 [Rhodotorula pacifica]|uniref:Zn(II)2Cys6 transcription factor domain-containing protein n=1 Tax=Rhodotorula pacifica TaxID=1495444 RepID=UPI00317C97BD